MRKVYTFRQDLKKRLKNPAFKKAWEETEVEYQIAKQIIAERLARNLSQRQLAKKVKTSQAAISRIESMNGNPSLAFLKRIAKAMDTQINFHFK